jgi:predicted metalloprotease with PDZ domain
MIRWQGTILAGLMGLGLAASAHAAPAAPADAVQPTYLGVVATPLTDSMKESAKVETGVAVSQVLSGSPAAKVELRENDVITAVGNTAITTPRQLADTVRQYRTGDKVKIVWFRDGKRMQDTVTLAAGPAPGGPAESPPVARPPTTEKTTPSGTAPYGEAYFGVVPGPMTADMMQIAGTDRGVVIRGMTEGSPASRAGLQAGDVITSVNGKDVTDPKSLIDMVRPHKPGDSLRITYYRMGKRHEAAVMLSERPGSLVKPGDGLPTPGGDLSGEMTPEMRKLMENMRPQIDELLKQLQEQGKLKPGQLPAPSGKTATPPEAYDAGKDIGRIMERLDRLDRRLGDIEKRLDAIEKKK